MSGKFNNILITCSLGVHCVCAWISVCVCVRTRSYQHQRLIITSTFDPRLWDVDSGVQHNPKTCSDVLIQHIIAQCRPFSTFWEVQFKWTSLRGLVHDNDECTWLCICCALVIVDWVTDTTCFEDEPLQARSTITTKYYSTSWMYNVQPQNECQHF